MSLHAAAELLIRNGEQVNVADESTQTRNHVPQSRAVAVSLRAHVAGWLLVGGIIGVNALTVTMTQSLARDQLMNPSTEGAARAFWEFVLVED